LTNGSRGRGAVASHRFVKLAKTITKQHAGIVAAIKHGLSNARVEAINTQIRMLTRRAFGFHSPDALIALAQRPVPAASTMNSAFPDPRERQETPKWSAGRGPSAARTTEGLALPRRRDP
jgi:hypothetical protein